MTDVHSTDSPPRSTRRVWNGIVVVALLLVVGVFVALAGKDDPDTAADRGDDSAGFRSGEQTIATTGARSTDIVAPPGMATTTTNPTNTAVAPATPQAAIAVTQLYDVTDPQEWAQTFATIWNSYDYTGLGANDWVANVSNYATGAGSELLGRDGLSVWGGAVQTRLTVLPAGPAIANRLWEVGDASMWRVKTPLSMQSQDPQYRGMDGESVATWDFYIQKQSSGTYLLDSYSQPKSANTSPNTYTPAR